MRSVKLLLTVIITYIGQKIKKVYMLDIKFVIIIPSVSNEMRNGAIRGIIEVSASVINKRKNADYGK